MLIAKKSKEENNFTNCQFDLKKISCDFKDYKANISEREYKPTNK